MTKSQRDEYVQLLRDGQMRGAAAESLGLSRARTAGYVAEHPDFEAEILEAEDAALEHVREALYQAAITGNVSACKMWIDLKREEQGRSRELVPFEPDKKAAVGDDLKVKLFLDSLS